ncbi:hypothetical protein ABT373_32515 [Streptomyces sp. NPDC000070]|uniref:hypothetical protein n=1 Tax=Streptomyces sp. NPDC000070 TaxID=3154240 RepID=UPI003320F5EF
MHDKVGKLIRRRLSGNTRKKDDPTRAGVMVSGWGNYGKTASVCTAGAVFEDQWLNLHSCLTPGLCRALGTSTRRSSMSRPR